MKKIFYIIILLPALALAQSVRQQEADRELQTLQKLYMLDKESKKASADSAERIMSYRNDVKDEIRKKREKLSSEQYKRIQYFEQQRWQIIINRRNQYTFNDDFLRSEIPLLNNYRNVTLDYLYDIISE